MRLLLDTHALVWALTADPRLGQAARRLLAEDAEEVVVSVLSLWEIGLKWATGRMPVDPRRAEAALAPSGFDLLELKRAHVLALDALPARPDHRDPFDRLLLVQALHEGLTLMTEDAQLRRYGVPTVGCR